MSDQQSAASTSAAADAQQAAASSSKRQRRTPEQKIAHLRTQLARATAQQTKRSRQMDAREKIVIGGAVIKAMRENDAFRSQMMILLKANVTREVDLEAIAPWLSDISTPR